MKKIKLFIASFIGAIALVFACCLGGRVNAASTQPYVNAVFGTATGEISTDKDGNSATGSTYNARTFSSNGFDFNITASSTTSSNNIAGNGLRIKALDNEINFTTTDKAKVTIAVYCNGKNSRTVTVVNDKNLSISNIGSSLSATDVAVNTTVNEEDYEYSYSASSSSSLTTIVITDCPATKFTITNSGTSPQDVFLKSVKIQPNITITYNTNGGSTIESETILAGNKYTPTSTPTKEGYTFVGWYTNEGLTDEYNSNLALTSDVILYAKWADASAVYNVNFMNDGVAYGSSIDISYDSNGDATIGNSMPSNPSKWGYSFAGWYTKDGTNDDWGTQVTNSTTITSSMVTNKTITLYARYTNAVTNASVLNLTYIDAGAAEKGTTAFNGSLPNTIYSVANCSFESDSRAIGSIGTSKNDLRTGGRMVADKETECSNNYIAINASKPGKLSIYARSTSSTARTFGVYKSTDLSTNLVSDVSVPNSVTNLEFDITEAGEYYFGGVEGGIRVYYVSFKSISDDVTLSFDAQYNGATDAASTKLRFIGTIEGIAYADYANITSMQFTFTFNGSNRVCTVSRLYKSINSNGETLYAADNANGKTMYVVYQLNNINREAYKGLSLTNCKFTLTFSDGSTKSVNHDDITLPQFTTVINEN